MPVYMWECPDCGTLWTATEKEETCGECGQGIGTMRRAWDTVPGDRIDTAPRYEPQPYTPFRNRLPGVSR
jgi:ABC-type ATPase with predicted acetyltransferase domain